MNIQEIEMFVGSMLAPAAKILWLLFLTQKVYQAKEIEVVLGMSDKTVTKGLRYLERHNLVTNHGRTVGYHISDGVRQLPLPLQQLASATNVSHPASLGDGTPLPASLGEAVNLHHSASLGNDGDRKNSDLTELSRIEDRNIYDLEKLSTEEDRNIYDLTPSSCTGSTYVRSSSFSSSSKTKLNQDNSLLLTKEPEDRKNSDLEQIRHWLLKAGVGPNSPKMRELLHMNLDLKFIEAHVLEFLYQNQKESNSYPTGQLIYRMQNGWASPAMRCVACLQLLSGKCICHLQTAVSEPDPPPPSAEKDVLWERVCQQVTDVYGRGVLRWLQNVSYGVKSNTLYFEEQETLSALKRSTAVLSHIHMTLRFLLDEQALPMPSLELSND